MITDIQVLGYPAIQSCNFLLRNHSFGDHPRKFLEMMQQAMERLRLKVTTVFHLWSHAPWICTISMNISQKWLQTCPTIAAYNIPLVRCQGAQTSLEFIGS